jgi:hypothetical protein
MRSVTVALAVSMIVIGTTVVVVLSRSSAVVAGTDAIAIAGHVDLPGGYTSSCQRVGAVPQGTSAFRISVAAGAGPPVLLRVHSGSREVTRGELPAGWGLAAAAVVPVKRLSHEVRDALVCTSLGRATGPLEALGAPRRDASEPLGFGDVALRMEYLRPGSKSWWSRAASIAFRLGLGRAESGTWIAYLALLLMIAVGVLAARLALAGERSPRSKQSGFGEAFRLIPRTARICALVAFLNAACWSILTPPFEAVDEPSHFAYTQLLAQNKRLPTSTAAVFSPAENAIVEDLHIYPSRGRAGKYTISSAQEQGQLERELNLPLSRAGTGAAGGAAGGPPLYYLLETIPYGLASAGTLLDQLESMRLLSALLGAAAALFAFLFIRETLPGVRWASTAGGLGVALAAPLGYITGAVNPDALLIAISAAVFYCLARAFRRGLTPGLAVTIGALTAAGFLTKLNFIGLVPGIVLGLIVLSLRAARVRGRWIAMRALGASLALAASPPLLYLLVNLLSNHPALGLVSATLSLASKGHSLLDAVGYIWQFYLPRLPWMTNHFPDLSMTRQVWFDKSVGFYGWLDITFPLWVDDLALIPAGLFALLCARALVTSAAALRPRMAEIIVYAAMGLGLMALIGASAYYNTEGQSIGLAEPRYLLPLLPLLGAALALAARGAGRRWGPVAGPLIVALFFAHDIFSQLLVVSRFYG